MASVKGKELKVVALAMIFTFTLSASHAESNISQLETLFLEGRYEKVVSEADRLIDSKSYNKEEVYYLKGLSLLKLNKFRAGRESLEKVISGSKRPKRAFDAHAAIGDSYFLDGDVEKAIELYEDILKRYRGDKDVSSVYYRLGNCYRKIGQEDKARGYFDRVRESSPSSFEARLIPESKGGLGDGKKGVIPKYAGNYFSVQAGYFKSKRNAEKLAKRLSEKDYDSYIEPFTDSADTFYRVKVGRYKSKGEAKKEASRLNELGYSTKICTNEVCQ